MRFAADIDALLVDMRAVKSLEESLRFQSRPIIDRIIRDRFTDQ